MTVLEGMRGIQFLELFYGQYYQDEEDGRRRAANATETHNAVRRIMGVEPIGEV